MEVIYTSNSSKIAKTVADKLSLSVSGCHVRRFSNGEISVSLQKNFSHVVIVANTLTNDDWFELFLLLDALKYAKDITLCLTYMGYMRQDTINPNESSAHFLLMRFLEHLNVSRLILVNNHNEPHIEKPFVHLSAMGLFADDIKNKYCSSEITIVSPDLGGAKNAQFVAEKLNCDLAVCAKNKDVFGRINKIRPIGNIRNKICILVDDIIDSGDTIRQATQALINAGARAVIVYAVHGVLSHGAIEKLSTSDSDISEIHLTDSIERDLPENFKKISIASLIIEEIRSILLRV